MHALRTVHALTVLVIAFGSAACAIDVSGNEATTREEKRFTVSSSEPVELKIQTFDGGIAVRAWDKNEVLVEIERRAPDQAAAEAIVVNQTQEGNRIVLEAPSAGHQNVIRLGVSRSVHFTVTAPRRVVVEARTGDGAIDVTDLQGTVDLNSGDGRIQVSNVEGKLKVHTGDGSISVERASGAVDADSGDGSVDVAGRLDEVAVRTGDGSVHVDAADGSSMKSDWRITTGDGRISLRVPNGFNASVDASTGDGSVHVDGISNPPGDNGSDRKRVVGQLGAGGSTLLLRSGDGSIDVSR
jgi:hypothetical protein